MRQMNTDDLFAMEVINLCDGGKLGCPVGLELDCEKGCITAILVPQDTCFSLLGKHELYRIPWCNIQCIGEDTILVNMTAAELTACHCRKKRGRKFF